MSNIELEARFKEINPAVIIKRAKQLGGEDMGERLFEETIFYDKDLQWRREGKFARLRSYNNRHFFTYKHVKNDSIDGAEEIEFEVDDPKQLKSFLHQVGIVHFRTQQKKRYTIKLNQVSLDIDQWPLIPAYLEIEGSSEEDIKETSQKLGLKWEDALFLDARKIIESYGIDVSSFRYFTFDRQE